MNRFLLIRNRNFQSLILNKNEFLIHNFIIQKRLQSNGNNLQEIDGPVKGIPVKNWIADSPITQFIEDSITSLHDLTGFSWTANIIVSVIMFRFLICLPLRIQNESLRARQENLKPTIELKTRERLNKAGFNTMQGIEAKNKLFLLIVSILNNLIL